MARDIAFAAARRDDLNAPRALAIASEVARNSEISAAGRRHLLLEFDAWLGLGLVTVDPPQAAQEADPRIDGLVAERDAAREAKNWARADQIRDELAAEGVEVIDTDDGARWRRK